MLILALPAGSAKKSYFTKNAALRDTSLLRFFELPREKSSCLTTPMSSLSESSAISCNSSAMQHAVESSVSLQWQSKVAVAIEQKGNFFTVN